MRTIITSETINPNRTDWKIARKMLITALITLALESNGIEWIMIILLLLFWHFYLVHPFFRFIAPNNAINRSGRRYRQDRWYTWNFLHHQQFVMRSKELKKLKKEKKKHRPISEMKCRVVRCTQAYYFCYPLINGSSEFDSFHNSKQCRCST